MFPNITANRFKQRHHHLPLLSTDPSWHILVVGNCTILPSKLGQI